MISASCNRRTLAASALLAGVLALAVAHAAVDAPPVIPPAPANAATMGPQELMDNVSKRMFAALDANREAIRKNPDKVYPLVDQILLPNFDTEAAAQKILAKYWRTATPEQQKRFVAALYKALLHTYGAALSDFTAERLKVLAFRGDLTTDTAMIRTLVARSSGAPVAVDYRLHKTAAGWKAYDVIIEGISYVTNYRTDLGAEADAKGLEAMISRLEREGIDVDKPAKH